MFFRKKTEILPEKENIPPKKKVNKFKQEIAKVSREKNKIFNEMKSLSYRMNEIIGLTEEEMREAEHENVCFYVRGYNISVRRFPWSNWKPMLVVAPTQVDSHKFGYRGDDQEKYLNQKWKTRTQGTDSAWVPPREEIPTILEAIKNEMDK